jgi:hypothetical protein
MIFHIGSNSNFDFSKFLKNFNEKATAIIQAFALSITKLMISVLAIFVAFIPYVYSTYLRFILRIQEYRYIDTVGFFSSFFGKRVFNLLNISAFFNSFDIILFSVVLHIFYSPTFLGSSHIYLSNESIWAVCLVAIIVFAVKYYQLYFGDQKSSLEIQIDEIKAVCLANANLAAQVNELQFSILEEQRELLAVYYELLSNLEEDTFQANQYRDGFLRNRAFELTEACFEDTKDYILKLGLLVVQIEDFMLLSELNETSEEIISQFIDERNSLFFYV